MSLSPLLDLPFAPLSGVHSPSRAWTAWLSPLYAIESLCSLTRGTFESLDIKTACPCAFTCSIPNHLSARRALKQTTPVPIPPAIPCGSRSVPCTSTVLPRAWETYISGVYDRIFSSHPASCTTTHASLSPGNRVCLENRPHVLALVHKHRKSA